jgi:hypothetical protein
MESGKEKETHPRDDPMWRNLLEDLKTGMLELPENG